MADIVENPSIEAWFIGPPEFNDDYRFKDMVLNNYAGRNAEQAWLNFCHPALKREAYEAEGWRPYLVKIQLVEPIPEP